MVTAGGPYYAPLAEMDFDEARRALTDHPMVMLGVARYGAPKVRPGGTLLFIGGTGGRRKGIGLSIIGAGTAALPALIANLALEVAPVRRQPDRAPGSSTPRCRRRCSAISSTRAAPSCARRCRSDASWGRRTWPRWPCI